jgi:hypothetical protein
MNYRGVLWVVAATAAMVTTTACRKAQPYDFIRGSVVSPDGNYVATMIDRRYRESFMSRDARKYREPITSGDAYVLVRKRSEAYPYPTGADFPVADVAFAMPQCGPLKLEWRDDLTLEIMCDQCGRSLKEADRRADKLGEMRILYSAFAEEEAPP